MDDAIGAVGPGRRSRSASVPMKLPATTLPAGAAASDRRRPLTVLPEMTLRPAVVAAPVAVGADDVGWAPPWIKTPLPPLARRVVPVASVPMKLPATTLSVVAAAVIATPLPACRRSRCRRRPPFRRSCCRSTRCRG